jgi:hypothetical protein
MFRASLEPTAAAVLGNVGTAGSPHPATPTDTGRRYRLGADDRTRSISFVVDHPGVGAFELGRGMCLKLDVE